MYLYFDNAIKEMIGFIDIEITELFPGHAASNGYFRLRNYLLSSFTWYLRKIVEKLSFPLVNELVCSFICVGNHLVVREDNYPAYSEYLKNLTDEVNIYGEWEEHFKIYKKLRRLMAEIVDFKFEKKRIIKKWEEEIDFKLKAKEWYIESKHKLKYKMEFIKLLMMMDVLLVVIIYIAFGF